MISGVHRSPTTTQRWDVIGRVNNVVQVAAIAKSSTDLDIAMARVYADFLLACVDKPSVSVVENAAAAMARSGDFERASLVLAKATQGARVNR